MSVYGKTAQELSPTGGKWLAFKASDIGINNSFSGAGGNPTTTPERTFPSDGVVRIYVVGDRVTHIEIVDLGWTFRSESMHGSPIRGGINSTEDWFTFGINSFKLMDPNGLVHKQSPDLRDKDFMVGVKTLTPMMPKPPSCFVAGYAKILTPSGYVDVGDLLVGDEVVTLDRGPATIAALPKSIYLADEISINDKLKPIVINGDLGPLALSREHRVLTVDNTLMAAKHLVKLGTARREDWPMDITYINIVLSNHEVIVANEIPVESAFLGGKMFKKLNLDHDALEHIAENHRGNQARPFSNLKGIIQ